MQEREKMYRRLYMNIVQEGGKSRAKSKSGGTSTREG